MSQLIKKESTSLFEAVTRASCLNRQIIIEAKSVKHKRTASSPPLLPSQSNEQIKGLLKDVMYNSVAQATLKIFQTPFKTVKIVLIFCVLVTLSAR